MEWAKAGPWRLGAVRNGLRKGLEGRVVVRGMEGELGVWVMVREGDVKGGWGGSIADVRGPGRHDIPSGGEKS